MTVAVDVLVAAFAGLLVGAAISWLAGALRVRSRERQAAALAAAEAEARAGQALAASMAARARLEATLEAEREASAEAARALEGRIAELQRASAALAHDLKASADALLEVRSRESRLSAELAKDREAHEERLAAYRDAEQRLKEAFAAVSADTLDANARRFLELASARLEAIASGAQQDLAERQARISSALEPVKAALGKVESTLASVESARQQERGQTSAQLASLGETQRQLEAETRRLVQALRAPQVRGRWGEVQLRRVVELAGMEQYCDFEVQPTIDGDQLVLRPDLIVTVPGGRSIVVDAKAPVMAYLEAVDASEADVREARLRDHAGQVRAHVSKLGGKGYWEHLERTPDFVVLFLPGEAFFSAALQHDPGLFEYGVERRVFLAGPMTLLALLRTVAYGWTQEKLAANAQEISALGRDLYERLCTMFDHLGDLQRKLDSAVQAHNAAVASLESRVLPAARRFKDLGVRSAREIEGPEPVERQARLLQAVEAATARNTAAVDATVVGRGAEQAPD
ncbi:MAG TPA: DNA recombination protein RmuC [Vicinamibacterales bacterium]|nr:DNA recombination protein RmuC [Vicinamibacterales bacterium]